MHFVKKLLLPAIFFALPCTIRAQLVAGIIKYNWQNSHRPDTAAKVYLCLRTPYLDVNHDNVLLVERVLREFDLSRTCTPKKAAIYKRTLKKEYGISDSTDIQKYILVAAKEETKIASASDVQVRFADSNGYYIFNNLAPGSYWLFIKSAHTNKSTCVAVDIPKNSTLDVSRLFDEYSLIKEEKFYLDPSHK